MSQLWPCQPSQCPANSPADKRHKGKSCRDENHQQTKPQHHGLNPSPFYTIRVGVICYIAKGNYIPLNNHLSLCKSLRVPEPQFYYLLNGDSKVVRWTRRGSLKRGLSMVPHDREALHSLLLLSASLAMLLLLLLSSRTQGNTFFGGSRKRKKK